MNAKLEAEKAAYQKNEAIVGKARPLIEKAKGSMAIEGVRRTEATLIVRYIYNATIADADLPPLREAFRGVTMPVSLELESKPLTDAGMAHLKGWTNLRETAFVEHPDNRHRACNPGRDALAALTPLLPQRRHHRFRPDPPGQIRSICQRLVVNGKKVSGAGLKRIKGLTNLEDLWGDLLQNIDDDGLAQLAGLSKLKKLDIAGPKFTDTGLANIRGMTELTKLRIFGGKIANTGMTNLAGLHKLKKLSLTCFASVTSEGLAPLKELKELEDFHMQVLSSNPLTDNALCGHSRDCRN